MKTYLHNCTVRDICNGFVYKEHSTLRDVVICLLTAVYGSEVESKRCHE